MIARTMGTVPVTALGLPVADGLSVVPDFEQLASTDPDWGELTEAYAQTPLLLSGLMRAYSRPEGAGQHLFAITMRKGGRLVGLATFRTKEQYVVSRPRLMKYRTVEFSLPDVVTPDFVVRPDHRRQFVEGALSTLFDDIGCQTALLTLPSGSPNVAVLKSWCRKRRMGIWSSITSSHAVVNVKGPWSSYQATLSHEFIRTTMKSKRRLEREGRLTLQRGVVDNQTVVEEMLEVDRHSWKEDWRRDVGKERDDDILETFLDCYKFSPGAKHIPKFWLMKLDGTPIAFSTSTIIGRVAYLMKTSYDLRYSRFSPGTVLLLRMFQDLFESGEVSSMDFFTMQDYQRSWKPEVFTREAFLIDGRHGAIGTLAKVARSRYGRVVMKKLRTRHQSQGIQDE